MIKHGNQLFPNDLVVEARNGVKLAGAKSGRVIDVDPETRMVEVEWSQGHREIVSLDNVEKG